LNATQLSQLWGALRILVPASVAAAAAAGWLTPENASALASALTTAGPALITVGSVLWSLFANSKSSTIAATAAMSDVTAVIAAPAVANNSTFINNPKVITPTQPLPTNP
jgi:hypothetical protein